MSEPKPTGSMDYDEWADRWSSYIDYAVRAALDDLERAVEGLPIHYISGYEWECADCRYDDVGGGEIDRDGIRCDHDDLLAHGRVLRLITEARERVKA